MWLLQHLARSQRNLGKKHLVLSDSMSAILAISKGRSSTSSMNRVCRQVAALCFFTGMSLEGRWIPSELNPADLPSRFKSVKQFSLEESCDKFRANHVEKSRAQGVSWRQQAYTFHFEGLEASLGESPHAKGICLANQEKAEEGAEDGDAWGIPRIVSGQGQDFLGGEGSVSTSVGKLPEGLGRVHRLVQKCGHQSEDFGTAGRGGDREDELPLLRGRRHLHGYDVAGIGEVLSQGRSQDRGAEESVCGHEGLPEAEPTTGPGSPALATPLPGGERLVGEGLEHCFVAASDLGDMCKAGRDIAPSKEGLGGTFRSLPALGGDSELWLKGNGPSGGLPRAGLESPESQKTGAFQPRGRPNEASGGDNIQSGRARRSSLGGSALYLQGLGYLMKKVLKNVGNNDPIFPFAMYEAVRKFNLVVKKFGLDKVGVVCTYQIRHGSASTDALQGLRTLEQIQRRGKWQTLKSVRRYSNGGRVSQVFASLEPKLQAKAQEAEQWMAATFAQFL